MIDGTSAKQLNLSEITEVVSSSVTSNGWKRYNVGESSRIDYNYRFDLYIRRRNLSELMSKNDDISKKSSNVLAVTNGEDTRKIKGFETLPSMVSNGPMGNPKKDLTPSPIMSIIKGSENLPVLSGFSNYPSLAAARTKSPAQNVVQKTSWTAFKDTMEDLGCSSITNPVSACMITSIVRAELLAAQNQCHSLGYMTCSVTTDGFISDIPEDTLKSLDLYGLRPFMEQARLFLTNGKDAEIWEIKHCQDDLINYTTRGNVSLYCKTSPMLFNGKEYEGVCAHNSTKSGYPSDSYEDRLWLMTQVLKRTGTVNYQNREWTTFKELVQGKDFVVKETTKHIRMDFDMKRKPDRDSFCTSIVTIEGETYEIANFTTVPFRTVAEFKEYRQRKATVSCLRTMDDWNMFWFKTDAKSTNVKVRDIDWSILNSCIMGHRAGFWTIPKLDELQGAERDAWINSHNSSNKVWKPNDWKNAGRNSRQANMLPREMLKEKLQELMSD